MKSLTSIGAAIAALGLTSMLAHAVPRVGVLPVGPSAPVVASYACEHCATPMPRPLQDGETDLVITTTLADDAYISVWQSKTDNLVYGQCYSPDGQAHSDIFRINAEAQDGILPIITPQSDGSFVAQWKRDGKRFKQQFDSQGHPRGEVVLLQ